MPEIIILPKWGMTMTEGTVAKWFKQIGDAVEAGENLVEIQTEKVSTIIEAPISGRITAILIQEGETVPVGSELAIITPRG